MKRIPLLALCCLALTLANCKKNDNNVSNPTTSTEALDRLYSALRYTPQSFTVTAGTATKINGDKGTIISFYPNSFMDKNGTIITSGTVNISLVEMYSVGDMISNRATTALSDGVLTSSGQVNINATMNGQTVYANKYGLGFSASSYKAMELYYRNSNGGAEVTWAVADTTKTGTKASVTTVLDTATSIEKMYYIFDSATSFNFVNCDHPYDSTCKNVAITVNTYNSRLNSSNTALWVCYSSKKVVICLYGQLTSSGTIVYKGYAPVGPNCKLVLIANDVVNNADNYFYYDQSNTLSETISVTAAMESQTVSGMKAKLSEL